jgi:hypothetical protein
VTLSFFLLDVDFDDAEVVEVIAGERSNMDSWIW